ncbi:MAG: hypothetical protein U9M95_06055 [Candidatus Altiarchaeota archaeon]|nr:hypothetical protein [Candidatus Altiarchaeota archaeon]
MSWNKKTNVAILVIMVLFGSLTASAVEQKRILFYEKNSAKGYTIETDYSTFKDALEGRGYVVESLGIELSRDVLQTRDPDVLVIAALSSQLSSTELAAIFEFVMQKNRGLFILGGSASKKGISPANQITIPFGMTLDSAILQDERNPVVGGTKITEKDFVVNTFNPDSDPTIGLAIQGVREIAFFEGSGIDVPKSDQNSNVKTVAICGRNAYSPESQIFQKGSRPPIAAAGIVGEGLVFVLSDEDMLTNDHLDTTKYKYDNLRFGTNIVDWLRTTKIASNVSADIDQLIISIGSCITLKERINDTLQETTQRLDKTIAEKTALAQEYEQTTMELNELKEQADPILHINYMYWAIAVVAIAVILLSVVVAGRKTKKAPSDEKEEVFGYEFEEGFGEEDDSGNLNVDEEFTDFTDVGAEVKGKE